ncbi:MAG: TonB-dependent receptor [Acidobacteriota bacterium]
MRNASRRSLWTLATCGLFAAGALVSQEAPPTEDETPVIDEEIVVTSQKIERSQQETKESIAVITAADVEERVLLQLDDVLNETANVVDLFNGERFAIRGVSDNSASTGGGGGELATYFLDGVALTGAAKRLAPLDMWDVDQVEVLRGPQSTNLGRNSMMGAIVVSSLRPQLAQTSASVRLGVGNGERLEGAAVANFGLGEKAALRISGEYFENEGFLVNPTLGEDDFDARENQTYRAKLQLFPSDSLVVYANLQTVEGSRGQNVFRSDLIDDIEDRINLSNIDGFEELDGTLVTLDLAYQLNSNWGLRSISSALDAEDLRQIDDDLSPVGFDASLFGGGADTNFSQELRADFGGAKAAGTIGSFFTSVERENESTNRVNLQPTIVGVPDFLLPFYPALLPVENRSQFEGDTENISIFTDWTIDLSDKWLISLGGRYEEESQTNDSFVENVADPGVVPDPAQAGALAAQLLGPAFGPIIEAAVAQVNEILLANLRSTEAVTEPDFDATLFKFGATYAPNDDFNISAFINQGYRAGGVSLSATGIRSDYEPEFIDNVEVAMRTISNGGRVVFNANAYYGDWSDQQVQTALSGNIFDTIIENVGESTIYGLETSLNVRGRNGVDGFLNAGYAFTEFDQFISLSEGDLSGNRFAFSPEWTLAGGINYTKNRWSGGVNANWVSEMFSDTQNENELDSRTIVNAQIAYRADRFLLSAYGKNLTDEVYRTSQGTGFAPGSVVTAIGDPREYGLRFRIDF